MNFIRAVARDILNGLDTGLTELLGMVGIDRASRAEKRAVAALMERGR
jgi:hypothetical protein